MKFFRHSFVFLISFFLMLSCGVFAQSDDFEAMLQRGFYEQEVLGQPNKALETYQLVLNGDGISEELQPVAFYRMLSCLLQLHRYDEARSLYRRFVDSYDVSNSWVLGANEMVPAYFKVKHLPWTDGETAIYKWTTQAGKLVGFSAMSTSLIENDGDRFWSLESHMIGDSYRHYRVDFEETSLVPSFSFYRMRRKDPLEDKWISDFITVDHFDIDSEWDHETVGYLLRQYSMGLGFSTQDSFFKPSEGMSLHGDLEVSSIETQLMSDGKRSSYHVELDLEGITQDFWIDNNDAHHLLKFSIGELVGERIASLDMKERGDALDYTFSFGRCSGKRFAGWYPVVVENETANGVVFLLPDQSKSLILKTLKRESVSTNLISQVEAMNAQFADQQMLTSAEFDQLGVQFPSAFWGISKIIERNGVRYSFFGCVETNGRVVQILCSCSDQDLASMINQVSKLVRTLEVDTSR